MEAWLENFARANFRRSADTAHDLKTPLNVAVLNLELLRMRLRKLLGEGDQKVEEYTRAIEVELRRMGHIFDAFFLLSTPPKHGEEPVPVDVAAICAEHGVEQDGEAWVNGHEARIRQACTMFFEGASSVLSGEDRRISVTRNGSSWAVSITGTPCGEDFEITRIFKLYYTDPQGNPDFSLAVARLIAETYGGDLIAAAGESGKVSLRLSFPLGER